ncbi:MAG TPA: prepilin-type N-terminal cleavage/methylation domain-containing protein [Methylomirabilota bacterium]
MSSARALLRDERGFTLAELLVVTAVLGLILAGVVLVQQRGQEAYLFGSHRVEVQQNNRSALELMVRELRSATAVTAIPSATNLTFNNADGVATQYQLSGTALNRTVAGTTTPLIGGVQTLNMTYFSEWDGAANTGTSTASPSSVRLIRIKLVTATEDQVGAASPSNQRATMESLVRLRNIP